MSPLKDEIREHIWKEIKTLLDESGRDPSKLDDYTDFFESGILSSLEFMSMISSLEEKYSLELDFEDLDPSEFTTVEGMTRLTLKAMEDRGSLDAH